MTEFTHQIILAHYYDDPLDGHGNRFSWEYDLIVRVRSP